MSIDDDAGELVAAAVTRLEEEDFVRAYREVPVLRGLTQAPLVVFPGLAIVVSALISVISELPLGTNFAVMALVFLPVTAIMWWQQVRLPRRQWRVLAEWQRQNRYEVRRNRFRTRTERDAHDLAYPEIFGWLETPSAFYLEQGPANFIVIPKRAFQSSEEIDAAREVFAAQITGRIRPNSRSRRTFVLWALLVALFAAVYHALR
jgi:hypothetical protein